MRLLVFGGAAKPLFYLLEVSMSRPRILGTEGAGSSLSEKEQVPYVQ